MANIATSYIDISGDRLVLRDADAQNKIEQTTAEALSAYATDTASGSIASFPDGADGVPVKSLKVNIEPVQSGSGDPSPDNVRPISGHTSAKVTICGKNLFRTPNSGAYNGITYTVNDDGSFTFNGRATGYSFVEVSGILKAGAYTINAIGSQSDQYRCQIRTTGSSSALIAQSHTGIATRFTIDNDTDVLFRVVGSNTSGNVANNVTIYPMLELGSSASDYEPFTEQDYTINLGGTRYRGFIDAMTGILTLTHKEVTMDGVTSGKKVTFKGSSNNNYYYSDNYGSTYNGVAGWRSESVLTESGVMYTHGLLMSNGTDYSLGMYIGNGGTVMQVRFCFPLSGSGVPSTIEECNAWLKAQHDNGTPVQVVYPLATPQTIQLTANEISTVLGQNNIWSDAGTVDVEYRADTKKYIDKKIADLA